MIVSSLQRHESKLYSCFDTELNEAHSQNTTAVGANSESLLWLECRASFRALG